MSIPSRHVPFGHLADLVDGALPPREEAAVRAHVHTCARCAADLAGLERATALMRTDATEDAPAHVVARAVRLFRTRVPAESPGALRRLLAALRFDSAQMPLALSVRAPHPAARQLLFSAGEHDLDLRAAPAGAHWTVSGQVLGPGQGGTVELRGPTGGVEAPLTALQEFALPPVPPGTYVLRVHLPDREIEVQSLELGP